MERGETQGSYTQLDSSTEYSIFAFGYKGQSVTTGLFRKDFTTETDIAKITFSINVDMSWGFHNIHIIPNPITALYYYEIVTEETTVKESLQIIDEIAKQKISSGWCRDRAHFFKTYGFEGEYWGSYMGRFEKLEQWLLSASRLKLKNIKFNNISIIGWVGLRSNSFYLYLRHLENNRDRFCSRLRVSFKINV